MTLGAPTKLVFIIALVLGVLGIVGLFGLFPLAGIAGYSKLMLTIGFILLTAGVLLPGL